MVYLIECEGRNATYYKIGYTRDSNFERRLDTYKLHNPFCKVLYTIPEATEDHEKLIQAKFNEYRAYRKEWFMDNVAILRFFDRHRTKESLDNEFKVSNLAYFIKGTDGKLTERYIKLKEEVEMLINVYCTKRLTEDNSKEIAKEYDVLIDKYIPMLGKTIFGVEEFKGYFSEGDLTNITTDTIGNTEKEFIEKFKSKKIFNDKMRFLCEGNFSESEICVILNQIPLTYKKYYLTLGPERCRANGYSITEIEKEYDNLFKIGDVRKAIYENFNEGEVYSLKFIKDKLRELYKSLGFSKSPKATDLGEYFEIKPCQTMKKGVRDYCLKLIKRKV